MIISRIRENRKINENIVQLKKDLKSIIVVQKEKGYFEGYGGFVQKKTKNGILHEYEPSVWIRTQKRVTKPDSEKRLKAKNELKRIFNSDLNYQIRYRAGRALGYSTCQCLKGNC